MSLAEVGCRSPRRQAFSWVEISSGSNRLGRERDAWGEPLNLHDIVRVAGATVLTPNADLDADVKCGFCADLMSDVLSLATPGSLLLTGLIQPQVVRTADMADIVSVLFVRGKNPQPETVALALELGIPLLWAKETMFTVCGRLYSFGLNGVERIR